MEFLPVVVLQFVAVLFTWLVMKMREPYIDASGWNRGYMRGIEQGLREAAEDLGGPPAPIRIEMVVK